MGHRSQYQCCTLTHSLTREVVLPATFQGWNERKYCWASSWPSAFHRSRRPIPLIRGIWMHWVGHGRWACCRTCRRGRYQGRPWLWSQVDPWACSYCSTKGYECQPGSCHRSWHCLAATIVAMRLAWCLTFGTPSGGHCPRCCCCYCHLVACHLHCLAWAALVMCQPAESGTSAASCSLRGLSSGLLVAKRMKS